MNSTLLLLQNIVLGSTYTYHLDFPALVQRWDTSFLVQHVVVCEPILWLHVLESLDCRGPRIQSLCIQLVVLLVEGVPAALAVPFPKVSPGILVLELMLVLLWHFVFCWRVAWHFSCSQ